MEATGYMWLWSTCHVGLAMGSGAKIGSFQLLIPPRTLPAAAVSCSQYLPSILRVLFPVPASLTYLSPELAGFPEPQFPAGSNWVPSGEELSALPSSFLPRVQQEAAEVGEQIP